MLMSLTGGAFVPPQVLPDWLRGVSKVTVNHWGNETLRSLSSGGGWAEAVPFMTALAVMGLVFTGLGVAFLRVRHMRGVL
jgi:ABC-type multidrug transport system permease subunit